MQRDRRQSIQYLFRNPKWKVNAKKTQRVDPSPDAPSPDPPPPDLSSPLSDSSDVSTLLLLAAESLLCLLLISAISLRWHKGPEFLRRNQSFKQALWNKCPQAMSPTRSPSCNNFKQIAQILPFSSSSSSQSFLSFICHYVWINRIHFIKQIIIWNGRSDLSKFDGVTTIFPWIIRNSEQNDLTFIESNTVFVTPALSSIESTSSIFGSSCLLSHRATHLNSGYTSRYKVY